MKYLRMACSVVLLAIVVAALAIAALIYFVDPNKLKPMIVAEVDKQTGYQLTIDGALSWSFYPRVGVNVEHMTLQSPPQTTPFLDLHDVTMTTELSQLIRGNEKLQGDLRIADIKLMNLHLTNAAVNLHWQDSILTLQSLKASLYDGTLVGEAHGQELSLLPKWDWRVALTRVQLKPLLDDVNGADSKVKLSGTTDVTLKAAAQGKSKEEIFKSLNGTSEFSLHQGAIEGIDLNYLVQTADALLNKQPLTAAQNSNQTSFDSLTGTAIIKDGVFDTNDLLLTSSAFKVTAQGDVNLNYQTINLALHIVPEQVKTQWEIPVSVIGALHHPDVRLDMGEIKKVIAKQEVEKVKAKVRDQIKEKIPGKAGEFLQNLLGK